MKQLPDFTFEKLLWDKGIKIVAGLDEVGRGSLAGPVMAGCTVFRSNFVFAKDNDIIIDDSKKLSPKKRELADKWIKTHALAYGIGQASVGEINKHGIVKATNMAFRRAIKDTRKHVDYLLIDAFYLPYTRGIKRKNQKPIIKGDSKSLSIAAASIIAKVYRDKLMTKLSQNVEFSKYNWDKNKGYGTAAHRLAIKRHGATKHHRKLFLKKISL